MPTNGINATPGGVSTVPPMVSNPYTPAHADIVSPLITIPPQALALGGTLTNYEALIKTQFLQHESLIQVPVDANATAGNVLINAALFNEYTHKLHRLYVLLHDRAFGAMEYRITLFGASTIIGALEVGTTLYYMDTPRINDLRVIEGKTIQANGTNVYTFTLGPTVPEDGIQRNFWPTHAQGQNDTFTDITSLDFSKFPHFVIIQNVPLQTNITSSVTNIYIRIESRMSQDFCVALTNISRLENIFDHLTASTTQSNITAKSVVNNKDFRSLFNNVDRLYISKDGLFTLGDTVSNTLLTPSSYVTDQDAMTTMPKGNYGDGFTVASDGLNDFVWRGPDIDASWRMPYNIDTINGTQSLVQCGQVVEDPYAPFILHLTRSSENDPIFSASVRIRCLVYGDPTKQTNWIRMINGENSVEVSAIALSTTLNDMKGLVTGDDAISRANYINNFVSGIAKYLTPVSSSVSIQLITSVVVPSVSAITRCGNSLYDFGTKDDPTFSANGFIVSDGDVSYTVFFYMTLTNVNRLYADYNGTLNQVYKDLYTLEYNNKSTVSSTYIRTYLNHRWIHWITPVALEDISYTVASFVRPPVYSQYKKVPEGFVRLIVTTKIPPSVATTVATEGIPTTGSLMPNFAIQSDNDVFIFDLVTPNNLQTVMKVAYAVEYQTFYAQFSNSNDWYSTYNSHSAADLIVRNFVSYSKGNVPNLSRIADFVTRVITDPSTSLFMSPDINGPYITRVPLKFLSN